MSGSSAPLPPLLLPLLASRTILHSLSWWWSTGPQGRSAFIIQIEDLFSGFSSSTLLPQKFARIKCVWAAAGTVHWHEKSFLTLCESIRGIHQAPARHLFRPVVWMKHLKWNHERDPNKLGLILISISSSFLQSLNYVCLYILLSHRRCCRRLRRIKRLLLLLLLCLCT